MFAATERRAGVLLGCVGNPERGDDGVAAVLARRLRHTLPAGVRCHCCGDDPASLLEPLSRAAAALCVDACVPADSPGSIVRLDLERDPLPSGLSPASSHGFGLGAVLALARTLGSAPPRLIVYAVQAGGVGPGSGLSPEVARALPELERRVRAELRELLAHGA